MQVADVVSKTQIERGRTALYLSSNFSNEDALKQLKQDRKETDQKLRELSWWPTITVWFPYTHALTTKRQFSEYLYRFRVDVLAGKITFRENIDTLTEVNKELFDNSLSSVKIPCSQAASDLLFAFNVLLRATENTGILRAVGSTFFTPCYLSKDDRNWVIRLETMKETFLDIASQYFPASHNLYEQLVNETYPLVNVLQDMRDQMTSPEDYSECEEMSLDQRFDHSDYWFQNISNYVDLLKKVQTFTAHRVIADIAKVNDLWKCSCQVGVALQMNRSLDHFTLSK